MQTIQQPMHSLLHQARAKKNHGKHDEGQRSRLHNHCVALPLSPCCAQCTCPRRREHKQRHPSMIITTSSSPDGTNVVPGNNYHPEDLTLTPVPASTSVPPASLSYCPGDFYDGKTSNNDGMLLLSNGLSCKRIATTGEPVQ